MRRVTQPSALVVLATPGGYHRQLAEAAAAGLAARYETTVLDLAAEGFQAFMSPEERRAYHTNDPLLDPIVEDYARQVVEAHSLTFVFEAYLGLVPPLLKGWLEKVLAPGVAFVFDQNHRVRPNLRNVDSLAGVATSTQQGTKGAKTLLLRGLRLNIPGRVKKRWYELAQTTEISEKERDEFATIVRRGMAAL